MPYKDTKKAFSPAYVCNPVDLLFTPLYLAQGLWVRFKTPKMPEPPGLRQGVVGQGRPLWLLVAGDSSAAGVGAPIQNQALCGRMVDLLVRDQKVHWRLLAKTGWKSNDLRLRLKKLPKTSYDLVLLATGVNDITSSFSLKSCLKEKVRLLTELYEKFNPRLIIVSGMPPMHKFPALPQPLRAYLGKKAEAYDQAVADFCFDQPGCRHLPLNFTQSPKTMAPDGFHPGPGVYELWAKAAVGAWREANKLPGKTKPAPGTY
jgi:lysophospholipase L1-like esterase